MVEWFAARTSRHDPVIVAEIGGALAGYASWGPFRNGEGYVRTVEHSVYVAAPFRRRGIARTLLTALIRRGEAAGLLAMVGGISGDQEASMALHRALGFAEVGRLPRIGEKFGRQLDLVLMMRRLDG